MNPTQYLLKRPIIANLITALIVFIGLITLFSLKRSTYPTVDFDIMKITTVYSGASAEDVEINVTKVIEDELKEVDDIDKVISNSLENLSIIYVYVDTNAPNIERVKDEIARAVDRVPDLPPEVDEKPKIKEFRSTNVAVIEIAIHGNAEEIEMRKIARDLEEEIKEMSGVGSVEKVGYRKREVKILASSEKLEENYVSLNNIVQAIKNRNIRTSGGNLESYVDEKKIVTFAEFDKPLDVGKVIVRSNFSGQQIQLDQIAEIKDTFEDADVSARTSQRNSINLLIRSQANADIIDISDEIKELLERFRKTLPENVKIEIVSDFSHYTANLLGIVKNNALIGFLLVLGCLFIFLTRYIAIWTAAGIPLSIFGALIFFPLFNVDINFISLITMVLVLGLLVDDAIVVAENITRHREMGKSPIEASLDGVKEVFWPVFTTIVTTIIAFIPMFFMVGITGKFIYQIPLVVIITLIFSLLESTLILPSHIAHSPLRPPRKRLWFEKLKSFYENLLVKALHKRKKTLITFVSFLTASFLLMAFALKLVLFPYQDIDMFHTIAELPKGASMEQTSEKMKEVEKLVAEIPDEEMVNYTTRIGHHDTDVYGATAGLHDNWAVTTVYLRPASERDRKSEEIMDELEGKFKNLKGFDKLFLEKFNDGPPIGKPITVTLVSDDDTLRRNLAKEMYDFIKNIPGVFAMDIDEKMGKDELKLIPDYELMARLGITARNVADTIRAAYDGVVATSITRAGEEIDFRIQLTGNERKNIEVLKELQISNLQGKLIKLGTFTKMVPSTGLESIKHYNSRRSVTITGDVDEKIVTSKEANQKIRKKFTSRVEVEPGLRLIFGGEEKATQESMTSFYWAFLCAMVAIYCVLVLLFGSFKQPFVIMAAIPFGFAGVIIVFFLHGQPISFLGMIGCLGLIGIVVNDSLVMVTHINNLSKKHGKLTLDIIIQGAKDRIRAVLLTTITTVAGMLPTIYGFGGYEPFIVPIVLAVAGGLIFATVITLILVPTLYSLQVSSTSQQAQQV